MDLRVSDFVGYSFASEPVINAPADVTGTCVCPVCPPGIGIGFFWKGASVGVNVSGLFEVIKALALFIGEAVLAYIGLRVCKVDFRVSNIKITAK